MADECSFKIRQMEVSNSFIHNHINKVCASWHCFINSILLTFPIDRNFFSASGRETSGKYQEQSSRLFLGVTWISKIKANVIRSLFGELI